TAPSAATTTRAVSHGNEAVRFSGTRDSIRSGPSSALHGQDDDGDHDDAERHHGGVGADKTVLQAAQRATQARARTTEAGERAVDERRVAEDERAGEVLTGAHD